MEQDKLECPIIMQEVSNCLQKIGNNFAPGFMESFYEMIWGYLKFVVLDTIYQIFEDTALSAS